MSPGTAWWSARCTAAASSRISSASADDTAGVDREAMALGHGAGGTAYADPGELA